MCQEMVNCRKPAQPKRYWPNWRLAIIQTLIHLLFQAPHCYLISKIETPTVQDFFMLCWLIGRQLSASVACTGIANGFFSCITGSSLVILQSSREPACFTMTASWIEANKMLNNIRKLLLFSLLFLLFQFPKMHLQVSFYLQHQLK